VLKGRNDKWYKFNIILAELVMKWKALKLMNTDSVFDFLDKSDPYLKFIKIRQDNTYICVAQT
jgi:hypothetical protein